MRLDNKKTIKDKIINRIFVTYVFTILGGVMLFSYFNISNVVVFAYLLLLIPIILGSGGLIKALKGYGLGFYSISIYKIPILILALLTPASGTIFSGIVKEIPPGRARLHEVLLMALSSSIAFICGAYLVYLLITGNYNK